MSQKEVATKNPASSLLPKTPKGEATRERILQAAEEVFGEKGYYLASVVDITQRAKIAQGTFYLYFPSKEALFRQLVEQLSRDFRRMIQQEIAHATSPLDAQLMGFRTFFMWVKEHRHLYRIVQQAVLVDEELFRWYYERLAQGYEKGLVAGVQAEAFRPLHTETVAYLLMGIGQFIGMRWVYWEDAEVPEHVMEELMQFVRLALQRSNDEEIKG